MLSPIIAAIFSALSSPELREADLHAARRFLHTSHIIVTLLNNIRESEEKRPWKCSAPPAELVSAGTYSGGSFSPVPLSKLKFRPTVRLQFVLQRRLITQLNRTQQIKPQGGIVLFLELIKQ